MLLEDSGVVAQVAQFGLTDDHETLPLFLGGAYVPGSCLREIQLKRIEGITAVSEPDEFAMEADDRPSAIAQYDGRTDFRKIG